MGTSSSNSESSLECSIDKLGFAIDEKLRAEFRRREIDAKEFSLIKSKILLISETLHDMHMALNRIQDKMDDRPVVYQGGSF